MADTFRRHVLFTLYGVTRALTAKTLTMSRPGPMMSSGFALLSPKALPSPQGLTQQLVFSKKN
jgi:hypothetical protein